MLFAHSGEVHLEETTDKGINLIMVVGIILVLIVAVYILNRIRRSKTFDKINPPE